MIVAGYHQGGLRQVNMQLWNWRGLDVINAHERDPAVYLQGMQAAVDLIARTCSQKTKTPSIPPRSQSLTSAARAGSIRVLASDQSV